MEIVGEPHVLCWELTARQDVEKFECEACGPTNHVIGGPNGIVCCKCQPWETRRLLKDRG